MVHSLKNQHLDGRLNNKSLAGNNPYKSNHFNSFKLSLKIDSTYQITDFIVNVSVLNERTKDIIFIS